MSYRVDTVALTALTDRMQRVETDLADSVDAARAALARVHATWNGAAADEHRAAAQRWAGGAQRMHEALASLRATLRVAEDRYDALCSANVAMWG